MSAAEMRDNGIANDLDGMDVSQVDSLLRYVTGEKLDRKDSRRAIARRLFFSKNIFIIFQKPLDKNKVLWYHIVVAGKRHHGEVAELV
jgi:hypothetical protein